MKPASPIAYFFATAIMFISCIVVTNFYTVISTQTSALKNKLNDTKRDVQTIENKSQLLVKDLNRFQAKKYGIEVIQSSDLITP